MEPKEKKHLVEDAASETKAAVEEGTVAGGGGGLLQRPPRRRSGKVDLEGDELTGVGIVRRALEEPTKQIAMNAGFEGGVAVEKVRLLDPGWAWTRSAASTSTCSRRASSTRRG